MRILFGLVIGLVLLACGPGGPTPSPTPVAGRTISVGITVSGDSGNVTKVGGSGCEGKGGYADMKVGTQFTIKDPSGTLIGFGSFTSSHYGPEAGHCSFQGNAANVPDAPIYSVEVGRRGTVNFTRADLEANGWLAQLTLGD